MSDVNDIVAVGLDLRPKTLLHAYANGVFPWPSPGLPLLWYCPTRRGVLKFKDLHVGDRLTKYLKKAPWAYSVDTAFAQVIEECSQRGPIRGHEGEPSDTWITDEMKAAYIELHRLGHAHSVEVWNGKNLVGGLYGVDTANYFAGESMFHRETNASKAALLFAISRQMAVGREWMDIQVVTPHMEAFGAKEVTRKHFMTLLVGAQNARKHGSGVAPFEKVKDLRYCDFSSFI
ncbi:MAG: leucyl/phenylalanyl-tRNA--protein transferase [Bdellovibrionales bacterium]|nr:leucyl/phenylalanyl-tRNA--protein transferase [Bdellovibrionales bacterium]